MADLLRFEFANQLTPSLEKLPSAIAREVQEAVEEATKRAVQIAKFKTPVDRGTAIGGWRTELPKAGSGAEAKGAFVNDVPYINVLEFGGYPVRPARFKTRGAPFFRGAAALGGLPPGPRTRTAPGGEPKMRSNVSKQAPKGMVRSTLLEVEPEFLADLEERINRVVAGEG